MGDFDPETIAASAGTTPRLVTEAFSPRPHPLTLRAVLALEVCQCAILSPGGCTGLDVVLAAHILQDPRAALDAYAQGTLNDAALHGIATADIPRLTAQVCGTIQAAFAPVATDTEPSESFHPPGTGWWLHLLDALCYEYGWTLDTALDTPLAQALCLLAAIAQRNGTPLSGPSFIERDILTRLIHGAGKLDNLPAQRPAEVWPLRNKVAATPHKEPQSKRARQQ